MARILIVDDEPLNLKALGRALRMMGHEVLTAGDGAQALAVIENLSVGSDVSGKIDLVISDVDMPNMTGIDLALAVKPLKIPVILSTGGDEDRAAKSAGVVCYSKPALGSLDMLRTVVAQALSKEST